MVNSRSAESSTVSVAGGGSPTRSCAGCGGKIADRFLLYSMERYWHTRCLKCSCCQAQLGEIGTSCFSKGGMILCRNDYIRLVPGDRFHYVNGTIFCEHDRPSSGLLASHLPSLQPNPLMPDQKIVHNKLVEVLSLPADDASLFSCEATAVPTSGVQLWWCSQMTGLPLFINPKLGGDESGYHDGGSHGGLAALALHSIACPCLCLFKVTQLRHPSCSRSGTFIGSRWAIVTNFHWLGLPKSLLCLCATLGWHSSASLLCSPQACPYGDGGPRFSLVSYVSTSRWEKTF
ncbi:LMO4A factor, partial [Polypterus senegalus]